MTLGRRSNPLYDVIAPESLTLYIDGTILKTEAQIIAEPKVVVRPTPGVAALSGSLLCAEGWVATYDAAAAAIGNCPSEDGARDPPPPRRRRRRHRRRRRRAGRRRRTQQHREGARIRTRSTRSSSR